MLIQRVLRNHIKFLNDLENKLEEIHTTIAANTEIHRALGSGFHMLKEKERKTVAKVLLTDVASVIGYAEATVVDLVAQLHYTSVIGTVSTTESDVYDIVYNMDIPLMITRMKQRYAEVESIMA